MPATVNVHRLTVVSSFDWFRFRDHRSSLYLNVNLLTDIIGELTAVKGTVSDHLPQGKYCVMATIKI
ncbi:unnamed protein product, partial [Brassica oleracea]